MRTLVIINPTAGGGRDAENVQRRLQASMEADFVITESPAHATHLAAAAAAAGYDRVAAAGGDGTVGQVVTGLGRVDPADGRRPHLALIPVGTGNDLARALGIPLELEEAARIAAHGRPRPLDLIRATAIGPPPDDERLVANAAVAGFCGRIGDSMGPGFRRRWRGLAYPVAAIGQLRDLRPYRLRVEADGNVFETRALMVVVANSRFAGGALPLAPDARTDDGRLDVVILEAMHPVAVARLVPRVFRGLHTDHPGVRTMTARTLLLEPDSQMWMNLDGDTWHCGSTRFAVEPAALEVLLP